MDKTELTSPCPPPKRIISVAEAGRRGLYGLDARQLRWIKYRAAPLIGAGGQTIQGNGAGECFIQLNARRLLLDLDKFEEWIERRRLDAKGHPSQQAIDADPQNRPAFK